MRWPWQRRQPIERRSSGFTTELIAARSDWIAGRTGLAETTATVQACISLWESAFAVADVAGTELLDRRSLALAARSLALRGDWVALIRDDGLITASDWDISTRDGRPVAYRLSIPDSGGGRSQTALAGEVLHVCIGCDPAAPWLGTAPLRRAALTAGLLHAVESALSEVYELAPVGSQICPYPESSDTDLETLGRSFRGQRGRVLLRESVYVSAAGGPTPATDWRPAGVTPDLRPAVPVEAMAAAREAVAGVFGVLPALLRPDAQGPLVREAQRHLISWTLQPVAARLAEEASAKLGGSVTIDLLRPMGAYDAGGRARAIGGIVEALAAAKQAGLTAAEFQAGLALLSPGPGDNPA